jgi:2-polyprenyl-3-methyl-5-hydroxy-6-metoxy-1,4-benzoquinol methylase
LIASSIKRDFLTTVIKNIFKTKDQIMSVLRENLEMLEAQSKNDFRRQSLVRILLPEIKGQTILDIGCGMGFMTEHLVSMGKNVIALDTELSFVTYAVQRTFIYNHPAMGVNYAGDDASICQRLLRYDLGF